MKNVTNIRKGFPPCNDCDKRWCQLFAKKKINKTSDDLYEEQNSLEPDKKVKIIWQNNE